MCINRKVSLFFQTIWSIFTLSLILRKSPSISTPFSLDCIHRPQTNKQPTQLLSMTVQRKIWESFSDSIFSKSVLTRSPTSWVTGNQTTGSTAPWLSKWNTPPRGSSCSTHRSLCTYSRRLSVWTTSFCRWTLSRSRIWSTIAKRSKNGTSKPARWSQWTLRGSWKEWNRRGGCMKWVHR